MALSNLSSETNTEPGSAFAGRALGMRWSKLGQSLRRCYQWKLRVSSKAATLSPFLEQQHGACKSLQLPDSEGHMVLQIQKTVH